MKHVACTLIEQDRHSDRWRVIVIYGHESNVRQRLPVTFATEARAREIAKILTPDIDEVNELEEEAVRKMLARLGE